MSGGPDDPLQVDGIKPSSQAIAASDLQRSAIRGSFWTAAHTIVSVPVAFVVNAVVARVLGPTDYGSLAILTLALVIMTTVSNAGVSDATIQWGAAAAARRDRETIQGLVAKSLGFHLAVQLPLLIATVVVLARSDGLVVGVMVAAVALPAALGSAALLMTIEGRTATGAKIAMVSNLVVQSAILGAALTTESSAWVWAVRTLAGSLLLPLNFLVLDRWGRRAAVRVSIPRRMPPGFWRFGLLTMGSGLASLLVFSRSEILVLQYFEEPAVVGLFALAFGVAAIVTAPVDALLGPLIPSVAGLVTAHPSLVRPGRDRVLRASSFLSGGLLAGAIPALFHLIGPIYGADYEAAAWPFLALAAASTLQTVCNPLLAFMNARRRAGTLFKITVVALVLNLGVGFALIPAFAIWGAVAANVSAQLCVLGLLVAREGRLSQTPVRLLLVSARAWPIGLVSALGGLLLVNWWVATDVLAAVSSAALGLALYVALVRMSAAGLTDGDWSVLAEAVPRPVGAVVRSARHVFGSART